MADCAPKLPDYTSYPCTVGEAVAEGNLVVIDARPGQRFRVQNYRAGDDATGALLGRALDSYDAGANAFVLIGRGGTWVWTPGVQPPTHDIRTTSSGVSAT